MSVGIVDGFIRFYMHVCFALDFRQVYYGMSFCGSAGSEVLDIEREKV